MMKRFGNEDQLIVKRSASPVGDLAAFGFMVLLAWGVAHFAGGFAGWSLCGVFLLFSILPLLQAWQAESAWLLLRNGVLHWQNMQNGTIADKGEIPLDDIERISVRTSADSEVGFVEIHLITKAGGNVALPIYLQLNIYRKRIVEAIQRAKPSIRVEDTKPAGDLITSSIG